MGLGADFANGTLAAGNIWRNNALREQLSTYPDLLKAQLQQSQNQAGLSGVQLQYAPQTAQAGIGLTNAQANNANANAGYLGSESGLNQWKLQHPDLMIPGIAGQIAGIDQLKQSNPALFGITPGGNVPVTNGASDTGQIMPPIGGGMQQTPWGPSGGMSMPPNSGAIPLAGPSMPNSAPQGMAATPNAIQQQLPQQPGQMFGGNPMANQMMNAIMAPMLQKQAQMNYYNARANQLTGAQNAGRNYATGSNNAGAGGTYTDPTTGQIISTDTGTQTSRDQRTIAGLNNAQQYLGNVVQTMPQFVTGWQKAGTGAKGLLNSWFGANYPEPSKYANAQANLKSAAEGIINGFGLNSTGENVSTVISIMEPHLGESPQFYQNRVISQLGDFSDQQHRAESRLASGIPVGNSNQTVTPSNSAQFPQSSLTANAQSSNTPMPSAMVKVQAPDGAIWTLPANKLNAAIKRGAKQVQ